MRAHACITLTLVLASCSRDETPPAGSNGARATAAQSSAKVDSPEARSRVVTAYDVGPLVALDGSSRPVAMNVVSPGRPRIYSRALRTWVYEKPRSNSQRLGYLRSGASSPTSDKAAGHEGCAGGWYPIEPHGFVCAGRRATLDRHDPIVRATEEFRPRPGRKLPYIYGIVRRRGPIYARLPDDERLRRVEPGIDEQMQRWLDEPGEAGASYAQHVWLGGPGEPPEPALVWQDKRSDSVPGFLREGGQAPNIRREVREPDALVLAKTELRVGYSFLKSFLYRGRRYGLATDLTLLPTDHLRPIQGSDFSGVRIGIDIDFPFAFVRHPEARFVVRSKGDGSLADAGPAPYRRALKLSGKQQFFKGRLHYETVDGKYLSDLHASRLDPPRKMPGWGKKGEKWIDVNLTKQTLVLYEGEKAVYATLVSTGEAGLEDPDKSTATKRGIFRIHTKHVTATMSSNELGEEFELRDVPYVQYFEKEGYALHGAYWHDRFGMPKSHGCINLAPEDARRIFYWTKPSVPVGWHGVLQPLTGTVLFVHQ